MLPMKVARRDPAPSRLRYRLTRLWLRPRIRWLVNFGVPMVAGLLGAATLLAEVDVRARATTAWEYLRDAVIEQPQFTVTRISVPDVSRDLAEQIEVAAFVSLPASSLTVDVGDVRRRIEALDAVERARVRALASGVLEIRAIERVPVVVWRAAGRLELLDHAGVRVAEIDSRLRRPDLPLIAGEGAEQHVAEALSLFEVARPVARRIRGLVRVGERRWDLVLDREQVVQLPEDEPTEALARVMELHATDDLLERDLVLVDMRDPARPMVRLSEHADAELERLRKMMAGEDV